ncbi:MAG: YbbR-like domain-containing protein [Blastocatellales bacterium]
MRHTRIENKGLKLLSLLLAILLFAVAQQPITDLRLAGVPIEYRGLHPGVEIGGDVQQTVSVRLRGPRDIVRSLVPNQLLVVADLSNKEPGERIIQLTADESSLPNNVKVLQIEPASIRIKLEPTAKKRVNVEARFLGQVEKGLEIYRVRLAPGEVEIIGPQSLVDKIDRVVTESVNLDGRKADFQTSVEVEVPQDSLRVKTPSPINLSVEIGEQRITRRFTNIPVQWLDKNANGRLLTKTVDVEVFGPKSAVEALRADDLRVEINTTGLPSGIVTATPQTHLSANAEKSIEIRNIVPREVKVKR